MLKVKLAGEGGELALIVTHIARGHRLRSDPGSHHMGVASVFLFMEDDGPRVAGKVEPPINAVDVVNKIHDEALEAIRGGWPLWAQGGKAFWDLAWAVILPFAFGFDMTMGPSRSIAFCGRGLRFLASRAP